MNRGTITFQVGKTGSDIYSKWQVFFNGKYIGIIDSDYDIKIAAPNGRHIIHFKNEVQSTEMEIYLQNNDIVVECVFDGRTNNFYLVEKDDTDTNGENDITKYLNSKSQQNIRKSNNRKNTSDLNSKSQQNKFNWKDYLIVSVIVILCTVFYVVGTNNNDNSKKSDFNKNSIKPDFGISLDKYINNLKEYGISNIDYVETVELDEGGVGYQYSYGRRKIFIYTRENGNIYNVVYNDSELVYGVGLVSDMIVELSSKFLAGTGVKESQSRLYSGVKQCINGGTGSSMTYDDCMVYYADTILPYYETVWIEAR